MAVETSADRRPLYTRLQVVRGFQTAETKRLCARIEAGTTVVSDGGQWFRCIADQPGIIHERHITGSDRASARHPAFHWANTLLANIKNSLLAAHRAVAAKHLPRYLGAFAWRFNRRFVLKTIHERLAAFAGHRRAAFFCRCQHLCNYCPSSSVPPGSSVAGWLPRPGRGRKCSSYGA